MGRTDMLTIDKNSPKPLYQQLYEGLKAEAPRENVEGIPLAPIRSLSKELGISKNTVERVYQQLVVEGYIYAVPGSGYYWNYLNPARVEDKHGVLLQADPEKPRPVRYNLCYGNGNNRDFPWYVWKKCVRQALQLEEEAPYLEYGDKKGYLPLREVLARFLKSKRGVNCRPEQIILCSGVQQAIAMLVPLLPHVYYPLAMEEPGYDGVRNTFLRYNYQLTPITVEDRGLSLDQLRASNAKLVYVTPSHQFPLGRVLPIAERYELVKIMSERGGYILEDDYDSEFRYGNMAFPSLQSLDENGCVIYVGSFSKTLSPTLRFTYMVLPEELLAKYEKLYRNHKNTIPDFLQIALHQFVNEGYYSQWVRKQLKLNERKYEVLREMFAGPECPACVQAMFNNAGVHLVVRMNTGRPQEEVLRRCEENGVRIYSLRTSWHNQSLVDNDLYLLGFSSICEEDLREAIGILFRTVREITAASQKIS
ncbi:MAG: PLP-dependent aminotransferase family protein [Lachnospiraceae bacterium]|nr:PLP-dependent aminotransferase family protein [Lachnospiraceae bacterium]